MKDYDFTGKVVLVTGSSGGLGIDVAQTFLKSGASLALTYHSDKSLSLLQKICGSSKNIFLLRGDFKKEDDAKTLVSEVIKRYGKIDVLANVIGGYIAGKPVTEIDEKDWDAMMDLNLKTAFFLSKHVVSEMVKRSSGKVIHVSARGGLKGGGRDAAYAASKSGVIRLVESLSEEVKSKGINVNCIMPSIIDTEENRAEMPSADHSKWVEPSDIARIILFLASEDARPINGAAIPVYGLA
ncbi:MAG TPA: SDR family NAD(P)-dependent oxidoreductase [Candidatus Nitrosotalea sp.]|nr:SDR family NAD(P)-dependent oxidoreductase [Candidatus Nitrosotalea sp.]